MSTPLERDRRLARLRLERQRMRQAAARRRQRRRLALGGGLLAVLLVGAVVTAAGGAGGGGSATPSATATAEPCVYRATGTTNGVVTTRPTPPTGPVKPATATLVLSSGPVSFQLLSGAAPCAVTSFEFLASHKYYDGTACDRLTTGGLQFLQCGGKPLKGTGPGYAFPDENLSPRTTYPAGTVGLVNHAANSNGAEFFLCYGETDLPPQFVPFGRITAGLDVLRQIAAGGATPAGDGAPLRATTIRSLRTSSS